MWLWLWLCWPCGLWWFKTPFVAIWSATGIESGIVVFAMVLLMVDGDVVMIRMIRIGMQRNAERWRLTAREDYSAAMRLGLEVNVKTC